MTDQESVRSASTYWAVLKKRLKDEGADELLTNCKQLKMKASDGKMRKTDVANTEQLLRIIQSIPSKKAEPFKQWLALVGKERLDEIADPELALNQLAEVSSTVIAQVKNPQGYSETKSTVVEGGTIAGNARKDLEGRIGRSVISPLNAQSPNLLDVSGETQEKQ